MTQLGGTAVPLATGELQLGRGETIRDTAVVLSRYLDAVVCGRFASPIVDELAQHARSRSSTGSPTSSIPARRSPMP